jgi:sporulation protein YlmC with PRC-barrel domain
MTTPPNHLHAMRDLADWQVMDQDGQIVGKVDDLAFTVSTQAEPILTSVLIGGVALARRFEGAWNRSFDWLTRRLAATAEPLDIPVELIERAPSNLTVAARRDALARYRGEPQRPGTLRLSDLIGTQLIGTNDQPCGRVADLWLADDPTHLRDLRLPDLRLHGLIVGAAAIGDRLGFDHHGGPAQPFGLRHLFTWLGRHTRILPWDAVTVIEPHSVRTNLEPNQLRALSLEENR